MAAKHKAKSHEDNAIEAGAVESHEDDTVSGASVNGGTEPGEPGYDWQSEYPGEDVHIFTASDGTTVGLARLSDKRRPKPGALRKLRKEAPVEQMWFVLETVASPNALAVSDEFNDEDYGEMFESWTAWNGASGPE